MIPFRYDPAITAKFTALSWAAMVGSGMRNGPTPEGLAREYLVEQKQVLGRIGNTPLSEIESLAGWRAAFRLFGVDPTQYRSAAEALLRRLTKKGDIPSINAIVDACNLVSIRYAIPVAALDLRSITGYVTVCFARGEERFNPLGAEGDERPEAGEVIFVDEASLVVARRWCWRQSIENAAREDTTDVLFTIEAQHEGGKETVKNARYDLQELLSKYVGGIFKS